MIKLETKKISKPVAIKRRKRNSRFFDPKHISPEYFTDIERLVANELDSNEVSYSHNEQIGPYFVDFLIFGNVVLECDGFWHTYRRRVRYDKRRETYLRKHGYNVYRLGWKQIKEDTSKCVSDILSTKK